MNEFVSLSCVACQPELPNSLLFVELEIDRFWLEKKEIKKLQMQRERTPNFAPYGHRDSGFVMPDSEIAEILGVPLHCVTCAFGKKCPQCGKWWILGG